MTHNEPDLGEKALSKAAEIGIVSQLDEVEDISVDIRTDPIKAVQGEVESVAIAGKGIVMKQDLRMEKLEINTNSVSINPLSAVFGNLELTQPTDADAKVVLTETDLTRAFNSDYLRSKMRNLKIDVQGHPITIDIQQVKIHLPGNGQLDLNGQFLVQESGETQQVSAVGIPHLQEDRQKIDLEILSAKGNGLTLELATAIFEQLTDLLDLRNFDIPGMSLQLKKFDVQEGKLVLHALTKITQLPSD